MEDQDTYTTTGGGGARYKLMSPAKLPVSRPTCITIPPGLSPTSFLESPVLLTNVKAEPSPTTGSFFKPQQIQGSTSSAAFSLNTNYSVAKSLDNSNCSFFEFRPHTGSASVSGFSCAAGLEISAGFNRAPSEKNEYQSYPSPSSASCEIAAPKEENITTTTTTEERNGNGVVAGERSSSDDGYNWRKYGQKVVKGSEYPRSYYKCTHPNCEVKKIFERSYAGKITEIVYKGTHDHPKPQPTLRRLNNPHTTSSIHEDKALSQTAQTGLSANNNSETSGTPVTSPTPTIDDHVAPELNNTNDEADDDDDDDDDNPYSKRRRMEYYDVTPVVKPIREPRVVVQTISEVDILDDGYRWRKYGQKVVRGNPNPRSYYKCTSVGCQVRKHVERASHDPKAVITTYEGKHNHDVPPSATRSGTHDLRSTRPDGISLDVGNNQHRLLNSDYKPQLACYGGGGVYGGRENNEVDVSTLRILLGP